MSRRPIPPPSPAATQLGAGSRTRRWRRAQQAGASAKASLPAVIQEYVLQAPVVLDFGQEAIVAALYLFFDELRFRAIVLKQRVVVDLRLCRRVGPVGVLLLAAEVERCNYARADSVSGYSPTDIRARRTLSMFGFHQAVGLEIEDTFEPQKSVVQIQTGVGRTNNLAAQLGQVAGLTFDLWGDQAFTDRIHGALNEAMTNVLMHAYDKDLMQLADACESGRWWVAGFAETGLDHAWFMALDLGVGIPISAPSKNKDLRAYLARPTVRADAAIIWHLITEEGRSRTGLPQHGKGIPTMISLIRDKASKGTLWIVSGMGLYILDKDPSRPHKTQIIEFTRPMKARSSGTLILWKVGRPTMPAPKGH